MKEKYIVCSLCKRPIRIGPFIFIDSFEKLWWFEDSKPYWRNKDSGKITCDECFYKIYWQPEYCEMEA